MYKLCLIQDRWSKYWRWYLQPIEPHDWPFDPTRSEFSGINLQISGAIQMAHELVPRDKVDYVYMDRRAIYS